MDVQEWHKPPYKVSTDPSLIPLETLNGFLDSEGMSWARPLPEADLLKTVQNSLNFGLYDTAAPAGSKESLIGYARCITDYTTFLYLTDVYVSPSLQGRGLGKFLCGCVKEVADEMPFLRRIMALTGDWERSVPFYKEVIGLETMETPPEAKEGEKRGGFAVLSKIGRGNPRYQEATV